MKILLKTILWVCLMPIILPLFALTIIFLVSLLGFAHLFDAIDDKIDNYKEEN